MKKLTVLWTALAVMTAVWTVAAQEAGFTITLNQNYTGAPANMARMTNAQGSLVGAPLPVPTRAGQAFTGWWTTASTGGERVITGATGTRFTADTEIFARWTPMVNRTVSQMPACMREAADWLRNTRTAHEPVYFNANGTVRFANSIYDQIWAGNGTVNWAVRWESDRQVTLAQRRAIARMLYEETNKWTRGLIGMEGWPFQEIPVTVVGWAVSNANIIQDRQPDETIWVNNDALEPRGTEHAAFMASAPNNLSRFVNFRTANYAYAGGLHNRFDMYLWGTLGFGGGAGGDWGTRVGDTYIINNSGPTSQPMIISHEIGHGFGFYDFYGAIGTDRPPRSSAGSDFASANNNANGDRDLRSVMVVGNGVNSPSGFDLWITRYNWDWLRTASPANRFRLPTTLTYTASVTPANRTFTTAQPGYSNANMAQVFTIANTGSGPLTNVTATFAGGTNSSFEIVSDAGLSNTIGAGTASSAPVSVRPRAGLAQSAAAYTDTLRIRGDNNLALNIPLSFSVSGTTGITAAAAQTQQPHFRFNSRAGTLRYSLGGLQTANLKIYDSRGRVVQTVKLCGKQTAVNTNLNTAPQMLIWKVEAEGRIIDQGRMR